MTWHSIHVHYHDDKRADDLVLDAVRPLFETIDEAVGGSYFMPHWRRGPHLRLQVLASSEQFTDVVLPAAERIVGGYLAEQPSGANPDPQRLLSMHLRLAELENETGPLLPWRPDNSLHVEPYDRRLRALGSEAASDLLAEFMSATTQLTFQMIDHVRAGAGGQRLRLAFDLMIAIAHGLSGFRVDRGFISYRSHAEGFLHTWPEGAGKRAEWDALYLAHKGELVARVRNVVMALDEGTATAPFVRAWVDALRPHQERGRQLIDAGVLSMDAGVAAADALAPEDISPFHQLLQSNDRFVRFAPVSTEFAAYRLALNYTYVHLTRLGVSPIGRMLLCHLAANAVEDCYGCSAIDLIRPATTADEGPPS